MQFRLATVFLVLSSAGAQAAAFVPAFPAATPIIVPVNTAVPQNTPVPQSTPMGVQSTPVIIANGAAGTPALMTGTATVNPVFNPWRDSQSQSSQVTALEQAGSLSADQAASLKAEIRALRRSYGLRRSTDAVKLSPEKRAEMSEKTKAIEARINDWSTDK